jgi:hypothetical protein
MIQPNFQMDSILNFNVIAITKEFKDGETREWNNTADKI